MQYAVRIINGQRTLIGPGLFLMHGTVDLNAGLLVLTCPGCGQQVVRYLVIGDTFEGKHARDCALAEQIRAFLDEHPEAGVT